MHLFLAHINFMITVFIIYVIAIFCTCYAWLWKFYPTKREQFKKISMNLLQTNIHINENTFDIKFQVWKKKNNQIHQSLPWRPQVSGQKCAILRWKSQCQRSSISTTVNEDPATSALLFVISKNDNVYRNDVWVTTKHFKDTLSLWVAFWIGRRCKFDSFIVDYISMTIVRTVQICWVEIHKSGDSVIWW